MEDIWSLKQNMDEFSLKRMEDGTWLLRSGQQGEYGEPTLFLDRKQLKDLHSAIEHELYPEQTDEQKYGTTDPATIAYEKMAEGIRDIAGLLKELGIPETKINEITDKIHEVEFINRKP